MVIPSPLTLTAIGRGVAVGVGESVGVGAGPRLKPQAAKSRPSTSDRARLAKKDFGAGDLIAQDYTN